MLIGCTCVEQMTKNRFLPETSSEKMIRRVFFFLPLPMLFGVLVLLLGLLVVSERGDYARIFYLSLLAPTIFLAVLRPSIFLATFATGPGRLVVCFLLYAMTTLFWSSAEAGVMASLKPPLYVVALFIALAFLSEVRGAWLMQVVRCAALVAVVLAVWNLWVFNGANKERLEGLGALTNPLLISHVYGFFAALWFGFLAMGGGYKRLWAVLPAAILCALLYATGSRTPMVAILGTVLWLALLRPRRELLVGCGLILVLLALLFALNTEAMLQRGLSYRTDIWANVLRQSEQAFFWGQGYGAELAVKIEVIPYPFSDPHNMTLSVLYQLGLFGALLWAAMYIAFLIAAWRYRDNPIVVIISATVVYGLMAGMTEGGAFLPRPREHWLLVWVPLGFLNAALLSGAGRNPSVGNRPC